MKVYFCNSFLESCWYVRCLVPLQAGGWDGDKTSLRNPPIIPEKQTQAVLDADIVVFHRPNDWRSKEIALKLRSLGKKIVADNDDTYKNLEGHNLAKALSKVDKGLDEFCEMADMVTCSTEFLAEEYRKLNKNVVVLPNYIDPDVWPEPLKNEGKKVRLGFVGSVASNGDYESMIPHLKTLSERDDVQIVMFALPRLADDDMGKEAVVVREMYKGDHDFWHSLNIEWHHFVPMKDYIDTLNELKLDIMVIPRKDDYFNRCKSNLKFLEASMLEVPCVVQGFADGNSPYQGQEDSKFMRIVLDNSKWMDELDPLIKDAKLRKHLGKIAKEYVLRNYDINNNIWRWEQAYERLFNA